MVPVILHCKVGAEKKNKIKKKPRNTIIKEQEETKWIAT
jgi:hypothetical protein